MKNNKGAFIIEVLVASLMFSIVTLAVYKTLGVSLLSSNLSNSILTDADLKTAIYNVLSPGQCEKNLHPSKLNEVTSESRTLESLTRYKLPGSTGVEIIKKGENFRDYLGIVKIELAGEGTSKQREFKVYYTRERTKHLKTRDNQLCDETDTSGCYIHKCNLEYEAAAHVTTCTVLDCFALSNSKQSVKCYTVENQAGELGRTLIGCGGTSDIPIQRTVAFGYGAGASLKTGQDNTFIGYLSGYESLGGSRNTFIGHQVGYKNLSGIDNAFIGYKAGFENRSGEKNTFIGYEAGFKNNSANNNVFIGYQAGNENEFGIKNVFIGSEAGKRNTTGWGNIFIGYQAGWENKNADKRINIGNLIYGKYIDGRDYNRYPSQQGINVYGKIKQCNSRGRNCKEVSTVEDSEIQELKDKINKLCAVDPAVCN